MAIYRLLQQSAFGPEEIDPMACAHEDTLTTLRLADRADPITELVAKSIIEIAQRSELGPIQIRRLELKSPGIPPAKQIN